MSDFGACEYCGVTYDGTAPLRSCTQCGAPVARALAERYRPITQDWMRAHFDGNGFAYNGSGAYSVAGTTVIRPAQLRW